MTSGTDRTSALLATGTAPSSAAAEFTASDVGTVLTGVILYNSSGAAITCSVQVTRKANTNSLTGTGEETVGDLLFSVPAGGLGFLMDHRDPEIELLSGDEVQVTASASSGLTYYLMGS
jgi:hypothetical protein